MTKPNIIYIHSHDTGRYIQPYGHAVPTPNLQKLAEEGVLFRKAFCAAPTCSPSRSALVTGMIPHSNGMIGLAHRGFRLNDYGQHIVNTLKPAGYVTGLFGVQHVTPHSELDAIGYDFIAKVEDRNQAQLAADWLDDAPDQPFFISVGFILTHREFMEAGPEEDARYTLPPAPLPDTPETRKDMAEFKATARELDRQMGIVFDALDRNDLADNTLVICTTDHGIAFPGMKCNLTDHGIGIMLMMRGPGGFEGGKVVDAMVSHMDIFPTICDLIGIKRPDWLQGESVLPLVNGEADAIHEEIYADVTYHAAYEPKRCVRTERYKYIRRFDDRSDPVLPNCDDGYSKSVWMDHGWNEREPANEQLYDLIFDPNEANNLALDPAMWDVLQDMRQRLNRWMRDTNDPLLKGPVEAPKGAKVNDPDGISPREETTIVA